jgi:hypothetical protein
MSNLIELFNIFYPDDNFSSQDTTTQPNDLQVNRLRVLESNSVEGRSALGTPFFMPVELDGWKLPNEPLIEISGSKTLIKTQLDNNKGTFKELFAINDYQVIIRGFCVEDNSDNYPEAQVRRLKNLCEKRSSIIIVNKLTGYFSIDKIVIESYNFPAIEGYQNLQPYELMCWSDKDFSLDLIELQGADATTNSNPDNFA